MRLAFAFRQDLQATTYKETLTDRDFRLRDFDSLALQVLDIQRFLFPGEQAKLWYSTERQRWSGRCRIYGLAVFLTDSEGSSDAVDILPEESSDAETILSTPSQPTPSEENDVKTKATKSHWTSALSAT